MERRGVEGGDDLHDGVEVAQITRCSGKFDEEAQAARALARG